MQKKWPITLRSLIWTSSVSSLKELNHFTFSSWDICCFFNMKIVTSDSPISGRSFPINVIKNRKHIYVSYTRIKSISLHCFFLLFPGEIQSKCANQANVDALTFGLSGVKSTRSWLNSVTSHKIDRSPNEDLKERSRSNSI